MKEVNLKQGTAEWLAFRQNKFTASDAPAVMGFSKYKTRDQLIKEKATGLTEEVTPDQQARFDRGHEVEALARTILEEELGEELYPVTGYHETYLDIAASLDGMDMLGEFLFEHKLWNKNLVAFIEEHKDLPESHWPQLEQQLYVSGANYCYFIVSDGTKFNRLIHKYESKPQRIKALIAAWTQFAIDLKSYEVPVHIEKVEAKRIDALPVLSIEINGSVKSSNLATYKDTLLARIDLINTQPATDQEFADAEAMVKFCKKAEDELKQAEKLVLGQVVDINEAINTISELAGAMRDKRLKLNNSVKARKEELKLDMIQKADKALVDYTSKLNEELEGVYIPLIRGDFAQAIKGKKNITSMQSAINDQLAKSKISVNEMASVIRTNLKTFNELGRDHLHLFPEFSQLVNQEAIAFKGIVQGRIADFKEAEARRLKQEETQHQADLEASTVNTEITEKPVLGIVSGLEQTISNKSPVLDTEPKQDFIAASEAVPAHADTTKLSDLLWGIKELQIPQCSVQVNQQAISECLTLLNQAAETLTAAISNSKAA